MLSARHCLRTRPGVPSPVEAFDLRRLVLVVTFAITALVLLSAQASAGSRHRAFVSLTATVTGPRLAHPIVLRGQMGVCEQKRGFRFWNFAVWSGASGSDTMHGIVPTSQRPPGALGLAYVVRYSSEGRTAYLLLYPFAHGGPWTYIPPNQVAAIRNVLQTTVYNTQPGWWDASGAIGQGLLGILRSKGLVAPIPAAPPVPSGSDPPWAIAGAAGLLLLVVLEARRVIAGSRRAAPPRSKQQPDRMLRCLWGWEATLLVSRMAPNPLR